MGFRPRRWVRWRKPLLLSRLASLELPFLWRQIVCIYHTQSYVVGIAKFFITRGPPTDLPCMTDATRHFALSCVVSAPITAIQELKSIRHYNDVIMNAMASQITSLTVVYSTVYWRRRSQTTPKLCVTGLCEGNSPVTGEFHAQRASNEENVSIWWRHHDMLINYIRLATMFLLSYSV